jgi:uncharacterized protein YcnI
MNTYQGARTTMTRKLAAVAIAAATVLVTAAPAWAHVTVNPDEAPKGGFTKLAFRVPNEEDGANTVQLDVQLPTDHPIASVSVKPHPGWTYEAKTEKLAKPLTSDDGQVTEAVSQITWKAVAPDAGIKPGEFDEFEISVGPLPDDASSLEFKAVQTYSNGDVVRWIDETPAGGAEPDHPAPVLTLTSASGDHNGSTTATTATRDGSQVALTSAVTQDDVDSAKTLAIVGIVAGALGIVVGAAGFVVGRRRRAGAV